MKFGNAKTRFHWIISATAAALVILLLTVGVFAAEEHGGIMDSGKCGENLTWTLYNDGLLEISGTGKMDNYHLYDAPWYDKRSQINSLKLGSGITVIGDYAFYGCNRITGNLIIPNSVTTIGNEAFFGCNGVTNLTLPNSVTTILSGAFCGLIGLTTLTIPDTVTYIGDMAFTNCSGLTTLTIPDKAKHIGTRAFSQCNGLKTLIIPDSVTSIGDSWFSDCRGLETLTIPDNVTSIEDSAFSGCSGLKALTIADSVESIGASAFSGCSSLESATFRGNAPTVGSDVFKNCADSFKVYCCKKYSASFTTYGGKWNGYPLVVLDDAEPTPEVGLRLTGAALDVGSTIRFSASVPAGDTVLWTSTDSNVASVENGTVTARSEGTAVIIAFAKSGGTAVSFEVTVNPAPEPVIKGDFDGDGHVTAKDRMILSRYLAGWPAYTIYFEQQ